MSNNFMAFASLLMAKEKFKKNNITTDLPPELMMGLMLPGSQPIHQILMTNAVVDKAITVQQKNDISLSKTLVEQKLTSLKQLISALKVDDNDTADSLKSKINSFHTTVEKLIGTTTITMKIEDPQN